jgi:hypothetical protein
MKIKHEIRVPHGVLFQYLISNNKIFQEAAIFSLRLFY